MYTEDNKRGDWLFCLLIGGVISNFIFGNLLLLDKNALIESIKVLLICIGLILNINIFEKKLKSIQLSIIINIFSLVIISIFKIQYFSFIYIIFPYLYFIFNSQYRKIFKNFDGDIAVLSIFLSIMTYGIKYFPTSFDMDNRIMSGYVNLDTYFHASISAMIKNYGIVSTGIYGLNPTPYHALSHHIIAAISKLSTVNVMACYGMIMQLFYIPILIFSIVFFLDSTEKKIDLRISWIAIALILGLYPYTFYNQAAFWNQYFTSESYGLSLALLFFGLQLLIIPKKNKYLICILMLIIISYAKFSTGIIYGILFLINVLIDRNTNLKHKILLFIIFLLFFLLFGKFVGGDTGKLINLRYFDFIIRYGYGGEYLVDNLFKLNINSLIRCVFIVCIFLILHFFASIVVLFSSHTSVIQGRHIKYFFWVSAFFGAAGIIFLEIPGGSLYYITNLSFFIALPFLVLILVNKYNISYNIFTVLASTLLLCLISKDEIIKQSYLNHLNNGISRRHQHTNEFIDALSLIRDSIGPNIIIKKDIVFDYENPQKRCIAVPFTYSAISEHAWINIFPTNANRVDQCSYVYYGYGVLKFSGESNIPTAPLFIPNNTKVINWKM